MPPLAAELSLNYLPRLPRRTDWRIGCAGAGFIVRDCHLVAYQNAGFNPVAIASRDPATARAVAADRGMMKAHATYDELLADESIEVLDVAVPPDAQPDLIRRAVEKGQGRLRGILAQKPLALSVADAKDVVARCEAAGIKLGVNQNMRYDQSVRALKDVLTRGWLGEPVFASIDMRAVPHWMPWAQGLPSLSTFVMSIHHLDTFRYWLGTPDRVLASTRPDPRTTFPHKDGINLYVLEYDDWHARPAPGTAAVPAALAPQVGGLDVPGAPLPGGTRAAGTAAVPGTTGPRAAAWDDVWAGPCKEGVAGDVSIKWRVEGTDGLAQGTIGWPAYPAKVPSTLEFSTRSQPGYWFRPRWAEVWFPDAFVGTMAQLLCAIEDNTEPEIGGRDNVETIALCAAVFAAATEHRVTTVKEFL
ncbi:MAG TPA: Gfo/Idh/MocA family oxidoreductase [Fimbriiglobus sp.]|nr:Gfo/Idh/MocA family oxidoreductase [Fimbriiglobus sp.]